MLRSQLETLFTNHLDPQENQVLKLRYGLCNNVAHTLKATGEEMGLTIPEVRNVLYRALSKLRKPQVARALRDYMEDDDL